jgi:polysaccharide export outer membrane protein
MKLFSGKNRFSAISLLALLAVLPGCVTTDSGPVATRDDPQRPASQNQSVVFRTGDRVLVMFSGIASGALEDYTEKIKPNGEISPPNIGKSMTAAGKTASELQSALQAEYSKQFRRVTVTVDENRFYFVDGQVRGSGRFPFAGEMTVLKAIATAGGFTNFAKRTHVTVTPVGGGAPIRVDCKRGLKDPNYDVYIYPGDAINVPRRHL